MINVSFSAEEKNFKKKLKILVTFLKLLRLISKIIQRLGLRIMQNIVLEK